MIIAFMVALFVGFVSLIPKGQQWRDKMDRNAEAELARLKDGGET